MNKKSYKELMLIFPASYSQIRDICNNNTWNPENEQDKIIPPNNFYALSRTPTLNLDKVNEIRELYNNKILSIKQISNKFNIHVETIREICNYHTWVLPDTIIPIKSKDYNPKAKKLTWQSVRNIKQRIKKEETYKQIAEIFNISISSVRDIAKQICWKDENDPDNKTIDY